MLSEYGRRALFFRFVVQKKGEKKITFMLIYLYFMFVICTICYVYVYYTYMHNDLLFGLSRSGVA